MSKPTDDERMLDALNAARNEHGAPLTHDERADIFAAWDLAKHGGMPGREPMDIHVTPDLKMIQALHKYGPRNLNALFHVVMLDALESAVATIAPGRTL